MKKRISQFRIIIDHKRKKYVLPVFSGLFTSLLCFTFFFFVLVPAELQPHWYKISETFFKVFDYFGRLPVLDSVGELFGFTAIS